jgi:hypothetical protein
MVLLLAWPSGLELSLTHVTAPTLSFSAVATELRVRVSLVSQVVFLFLDRITKARLRIKIRYHYSLLHDIHFRDVHAVAMNPEQYHRASQMPVFPCLPITC